MRIKSKGLGIFELVARLDQVRREGDHMILFLHTDREVPHLKGADKTFVIDVVDAYHGRTKGDSVVPEPRCW